MTNVENVGERACGVATQKQGKAGKVGCANNVLKNSEMAGNKYCRRCLTEFKSRNAYIRHIQSGHKVFKGALPKDKQREALAYRK